MFFGLADLACSAGYLKICTDFGYESHQFYNWNTCKDQLQIEQRRISTVTIVLCYTKTFIKLHLSC